MLFVVIHHLRLLMSIHLLVMSSTPCKTIQEQSIYVGDLNCVPILAPLEGTEKAS